LPFGFVHLNQQTKTKNIMTLQDIKSSRPSKEMIIFKKQLEKKQQNCRKLKEYEKIEKLIQAINKKLKY